ncbi:hypothetical protein QBC37DRAFT_300142 [Rhypophila decipiens]|uniref:Uncharacterized protein n=1 Tax=Rhypophila decipiens TaxID=261697 RepID=A0AAN7AZ35_9PEZI|nr:hypothetical protein QBC37DRAFT_300142 [Rhypophila decipiens]
MSGLEILGGIAAAAQLTKVVANFILNFGTRQNAPRQVKRLERILEDLNDSHLIESASDREKERLWELILFAEESLKSHIKKRQPNKVLQFFWPEDAEETLGKINDELRDELMALGMRVDRRYRASIVSPISPITLSSPPLPAGSSTTTPTGVQPASSSRSQRLNVEPGSTAANKTSSKKGHELPATLYLQSPNGVNIVGPLKVKYLCVLERDESTRLIHYERKTANHHLEITHRIPRSCLRFEDDNLSDKQVHFLDAHPITVVQKGKGHEVYFLHAKYEFDSVAHREDFIARMLERELLDRFYAEEILYRGKLHAQGKVVRLWRKREEKASEHIVTKLTYLAREERQWEWDLDRFGRRVEVDENAGRVTLAEVDSSGPANLVLLKFTPPPKTRKQSAPIMTDDKRPSSITTSGEGSGGNTTSGESKSDAERFGDIWKAYHPLSTPQFKPLPQIVTSTPMGLGWGTGGGLGVVNSERGECTVTATARSPSTSPGASPLSGPRTGASNNGRGIGKEERITNGGRPAIQPRLEGLYPP